jgi:hypothetical protein
VVQRIDGSKSRNVLRVYPRMVRDVARASCRMALALLIFCNLTHGLIQEVSAPVRAIYLDLNEEAPHLKAALLCINGRHLGKYRLCKCVRQRHSVEDLILLSPHIPEWLDFVNTVCCKAIKRMHKELRSTDNSCASGLSLALILVPASNACITINRGGHLANGKGEL